MQKPFNPLIDQPPETTTVNGREYRVETDYRTVLAYLRLLQDQETEEQDKTLLGLSMFYGDKIHREDVEELVSFLRYFIDRGRENEEDDESSSPKGERTFDLLEDSGRIYTAFLQIYRINLRRAKVHWWIFWELLEGLPEGTKLSSVIEIRRRKYSKGMSPAERNELARLKDYYRIGEPADMMTGLFDSLMGIAG
jgi:hypothetical protein